MGIDGLRLEAFARRLSIREVSRRTGIPYARLGAILRHERSPRRGELQRIEAAIQGENR